MKYVRLYGFDHKRTQTQFEVAWGELQQAIPKRKGSVVLGVAEDRLLLDGVPLEAGHAERGFAQLLNAAGLSSIQFSNQVSVEEFENLVTFVTTGLLDRRAERQNLCALIPAELPSGMLPLRFEDCP